MYQMMSLPLYSGTLGEYNSWRDLGQELERLGCDGIEGVWGGEDLPKDLFHIAVKEKWWEKYKPI